MKNFFFLFTKAAILKCHDIMYNRSLHYIHKSEVQILPAVENMNNPVERQQNYSNMCSTEVHCNSERFFFQEARQSITGRFR